VNGNGSCKVGLRTSEGRKFGAEHPPEEAARLLALELYREDKVSLGRAAELSQTPVAAFMDFAAKHGVPPLRYSFEDLEEERQTADRLKA
jgi:predicted HTH domain antitoxin